MSYAAALSQSGIGKAGWSIGSALASSANKGALSVAGWGMERSGADTARLPASVKKWLGKKEKLDEARGWARQAEERRRARKSRPVEGGAPLTFGDERGAFVLETHEVDSAGLFVETTSLNLRGTEGGKGEVGEDEEESEREDEEDMLLGAFELDD